MRKQPWAIEIAEGLRDWLRNSSYTSGYDLAHDLNVPSSTWYDLMRGRPVADIYIYARIYRLTGIDSADPRKIPEISGSRRKALTDNEWQIWLKERIVAEAREKEIREIEYAILTLHQHLPGIVTLEGSESRDRLEETSGMEIREVYALLGILAQDKEHRERSVKAYGALIGRNEDG